MIPFRVSTTSFFFFDHLTLPLMEDILSETIIFLSIVPFICFGFSLCAVILQRRLSRIHVLSTIDGFLISDAESERLGMFKWLSETPHTTHHKAMGKEFLPHSGNWLLQKKEFIEWTKESSSSILWLHGIRELSSVAQIHSVI